jgi:hypothetical protein
MNIGSPLTLPTSERRDLASAASSVATGAANVPQSVAGNQIVLAMPDVTQFTGLGASAIVVRDYVSSVRLDYYTAGLGISPTTAFSEWPVSGQFYDLAALLSGLLPSAFSAVDESLARDAKAEADRALEQLSGDLGKSVSSRLHQLIGLALEDGSPASLPSAQSFRALVDFFVQNRTLRKPALTLDDEGLVWAEWRKSPDCLVALRFLADGTIRWVISSPAPLRRSGRVVWRGDGGAEDVRSAIDARPAVHWIFLRASLVA